MGYSQTVRKLAVAFRLAIICGVLQLLGCSQPSSSPPATAVSQPPSTLSKEAYEKRTSSVDSLAVNAIVNSWGEKPDINWDAVVFLARMSKLAYADESTQKKELQQLGFGSVERLPGDTKSGFLAVSGDTAVIAFRGTRDGFTADWLANIDIRQLRSLDSNRRVHAGFQGAYEELSPSIRSKLSSRKLKHVWVTGHSLGGAMAVCCACKFLQEKQPFSGVVTFGQPRVGNGALAKYLNAELGDKYLRLMNDYDPVPILPPCFGITLPAYWHGGHRAWLYYGKLYTIKEPTRFADQPHGSQDLQERTGDDGSSSITEEQFIELQRELKADAAFGVDGVGAGGAGRAGRRRSRSQNKLGAMSFFRERIADHGIDKYLLSAFEYGYDQSREKGGMAPWSKSP